MLNADCLQIVDDLYDLVLSLESATVEPVKLSVAECSSLARTIRKAARCMEGLERELEAASANVDHMRGVSSRQIALRVEAQARAARLAKDARR